MNNGLNPNTQHINTPVSQSQSSQPISTSNADLMKKIADGQQTFDEIQMLTSSTVTDQLKVFLVAQARNELQKIIQLTQFLDKLETNLMNKVDDAIATNSMSLRQYSDIIDVIKTLLERSNSIVSEVLKDDSLTTITSTTVYQAPNGTTQTMSITSRLQDPQSRERVRNVLQQILAKTNTYSVESNDFTDISQNQNTEESENKEND